MTIQTINVGSAPNDGTGDSIRAAFGKVNANFSALQLTTLDYTGATDSSAALQTAIDNAGANSVIYIGPGTILLQSCVTISDNRVHLVGAGPYATELRFAPTANGICLSIDGGGSVLYQGSISDLAIYSDDSTYTKVALDIEDTSGWRISNLVVGGSIAVSGTSYWSGSGSIGIRCKGREFNQFQNLYITADRPIVFAKNPNFSIDVDHFNFFNTYLTANGYPCVTIDTGLNVTQLVFDGANPWVKGTYGLYWSDTTSVDVSNGLTLRNVRTEQGTDAAAYVAYIAHNTTLQNMTLDHCYGGSDRKGIYLRNCDNVALVNHYHVGATEALNVNSSVRRVSGVSCFWLAGSTLAGTLSAMGQRLAWATGYNPSTGALPPDFVLDEQTNTSRSFVVGGGVAEDTVTLANDAVTSLGATGMSGLLIVVDSEGRTGTYVLKGANNAVTEVTDVDTVFSATKDNASTTNVYYDSGYKLQNKRGAERRYKILLAGSYSTF
jgi:hypothetical protein